MLNPVRHQSSSQLDDMKKSKYKTYQVKCLSTKTINICTINISFVKPDHTINKEGTKFKSEDG